MRKYTRTETVEAEPMTKGQYELYTGSYQATPEEHDVDGYLVVKSDGRERWLSKKRFKELYK